MANMDGFTCISVDRFSSLVEQSSADVIPIGTSPNARNCRFVLTEVATRYGLQSQHGFTLPSGLPVTGLAVLKTSITSTVNE